MLRLVGEAESGFWALVRGGIAVGGPLGKLAGAVLDRVRPAARPSLERPQLSLWVIDGEGLPPRPWRLSADARFDCRLLGCTGLLASVCVARQWVTDAQRPSKDPRSSSGRRCQASDFPSCDTLTCAQGRGIRQAVEATALAALRGSGPGGRFKLRSVSREALARQQFARARQEREGRLAPVRVLDVDEDPQAEGG